MGTHTVIRTKEKMKLTVAILAAVAESKPDKRVEWAKFKGPVSDGDSKAGNSQKHYVPDLECRADLITSIVNADGQSGTVSMDNHGNGEWCYVNLGECNSGVDVEITHMALENAYAYYYDYPWYDYNCYDAVFFAHTHNGEQHKTEQQCGCGIDQDECSVFHEWKGEKYQIDLRYETDLPTKYTLEGSDAKMVFHSDGVVSGGSIVVDWKCHETLVWDICPSTKCYTQDQGWAPGTEVSCAMTNSDCLNVSCSSNSIKATFDAELFHTNLENEDTFMEQLESGHREMWYNGNKLELNAPCGFTVSADGVHIDWAYDMCNITPTMNDDEQIVYSVSLSSPGNAPGYPTIEFYVDTAVEASCAYNSKVVVSADGFWVNQEDVEAVGNAMGKLDDTFNCKFFSDEARSNQILSSNIVNMGEMIYGQVTSNPLTGLSYELVGVTVTNANNLAMSYPVIDDGVPSSDVHASSDGSAETGQSVNFSYLSFGFESETGTNQNELNIECAVDIFITPERPLVGSNPCTWGPSYWCDHQEECGLSAEAVALHCS